MVLGEAFADDHSEWTRALQEPSQQSIKAQQEVVPNQHVYSMYELNEEKFRQLQTGDEVNFLFAHIEKLVQHFREHETNFLSKLRLQLQGSAKHLMRELSTHQHSVVTMKIREVNQSPISPLLEMDFVLNTSEIPDEVVAPMIKKSERENMSPEEYRQQLNKLKMNFFESERTQHKNYVFRLAFPEIQDLQKIQ